MRIMFNGHRRHVEDHWYINWLAPIRAIDLCRIYIYIIYIYIHTRGRNDGYMTCLFTARVGYDLLVIGTFSVKIFDGGRRCHSSPLPSWN